MQKKASHKTRASYQSSMSEPSWSVWAASKIRLQTEAQIDLRVPLVQLLRVENLRKSSCPGIIQHCRRKKNLFRCNAERFESSRLGKD